MKSNILIVFLTAISLSVFSQDLSNSFYFFAIGDMPYLPGDFERLDNLIDQLNSQDPAFTVHVGDIKKGDSDCSDEYFEKVKRYFLKFNHPMIYTPGDNEWTDCKNYDTNERLDKLRQVFYEENLVLGNGQLQVVSQKDFAGYENYIENLAWNVDSIEFGTLHVVGTNNNLNTKDSSRYLEYEDRNTANLFWLDHLFEEAKNPDVKGLVIMMQAAMIYSNALKTGFSDIVNRLKSKVEQIDKPVLLVYGDAHKFMVDKPLKRANGRVMENFTAVQVFGEYDMHAVKISVDLSNPQLFAIEQEIIQLNK